MSSSFALTVGQKVYKGLLTKEEVQNLDIKEFSLEEGLYINEKVLAGPVIVQKVLGNSLFEVKTDYGIDYLDRVETVHRDYLYETADSSSSCIDQFCVGDNVIYDRAVFPMYNTDILKVIDVLPEINMPIIGLGYRLDKDSEESYLPAILPTKALQKLNDCGSGVCKGDTLASDKLDSYVVIGATDKGDVVYTYTSSRPNINYYFKRSSYTSFLNLSDKNVSKKIAGMPCNAAGTICIGDTVLRKLGVGPEYAEVFPQGGIVTGFYSDDRVEYTIDSQAFLNKIESLHGDQYTQPYVPYFAPQTGETEEKSDVGGNDLPIIEAPVIVENTSYNERDFSEGIVQKIYGLAYSDDLEVIEVNIQSK